ncbi:MAG: ribonuclease HII [Methanosarcinaceae archaeon]|nr:ribonuclease HII [Methanosarcinaceae archaeon]
MKVVGIDEAGKGPVIGPMCIAGVRIDESKVHILKNLGVVDSKRLSPKKREQFASQIIKYADDHFVFVVSPLQIDELRNIMSMNDIMVIGFTRVLEKLTPDRAFVDAADVNAERFGKRLLTEYSKIDQEHADGLEIVSEHKADDTYPIVSAASILAKVRRDELIEEIKKEVGVDFGSGYPSDPKTKDFLAKWVKEHDHFPDFVRHSWKTAINAQNIAKE